MTPMRFLAASVALLGSATSHAEFFVDLGVGAHRIESRINAAPTIERDDTGAHLGIGARRAINERADIGVRLELDSIDSTMFYAVRALDYRRHPAARVAYSFFAGAARLDLATPAYGWYLGTGFEIKDVAERWNLNFDLRFGDKVARDNLLPGEPSDGSPDNFHDVTGISIYLSRRF